MTEYEKKQIAKELLKNKTQIERFGDFKNVVDGRYYITIDEVYESINKNDNEFYGIKCLINEGEYKGDFFIDCIYLTDESYERGIQKIRNILSVFNQPDLTEEDIENNNILNRLGIIEGKTAFAIVETEDNLKSIEYEIR